MPRTMSNALRAEHFGPYKVIRSLGSTRGVERFVVLCTKTDTNRMLYRFPNLPHHQQRRILFDAMVTLGMIDHPHLLRVESASYDDRGRLCVITPYTGNHEGLVTLSDLLGQRGGRLGVIEASRAIEHLLAGSTHAHQHSVVHGTLEADQILVDRFGSIQIELYGYPALTRLTIANQRAIMADEIRSIAELAYTMITGLTANADRLAPSRVDKKLDRRWDIWFEIALDPIDGFEDAGHALRALPTSPGCDQWLTTKAPKRPQVQLGAMMRRFRATPASSTRRTR